MPTAFISSKAAPPLPIPFAAPPPVPPTSPLVLNGSFSGHGTFAFRYTWLKKGVDAFVRDPDVFRRDDAIVTLGVGKNMVGSIRHWELATQVLEEGEPEQTASGGAGRIRPLRVSAFGRNLFGGENGQNKTAWDEYLEDDASLWLLHWYLATNTTRATTWYWAFNLLKEPDFSREALLTALEKEVARRPWKVSPASLKADVSCFLRTYVPGKRGVTATLEDSLDCPLTGLQILTPIGSETSRPRYRFNNKPKPTLPPAVWIYALLDFWKRRFPHQETLSLREIVHGEASPGRVFRLDEDASLAYLDALGELTANAFVWSDTALVRQVSRRASMEKNVLLDTYYARR